MRQIPDTLPTNAECAMTVHDCPITPDGVITALLEGDLGQLEAGQWVRRLIAHNVAADRAQRQAEPVAIVAVTPNGGATVGWMAGHIAKHNELLYTAPPAQVPEFVPVAARKLAELQARGLQINGYALQAEKDGVVTRCFITHGGFVGWWNGPKAYAQTMAPDHSE